LIIIGIEVALQVTDHDHVPPNY